ncbi:tetratricopeptide repeat protein [Bradyrhizobium barranii]
MKSNDTSFRRYLCSASPRLRPALLAMLTVVLLAGCATADKHGLSPQQRSASDLADSEEIDPAARERISHALGRDADEGALRDALKQQPNNIDAAIPLARALLARNCPNDALEVLDGVLLATPGDLRALNAKAVVLDHEGRHQEAQELYRQALAAEPANPMLRNNFGLSLALQGKMDAADASAAPQAGSRKALARSR